MKNGNFTLHFILEDRIQRFGVLSHCRIMELRWRKAPSSFRCTRTLKTILIKWVAILSFQKMPRTNGGLACFIEVRVLQTDRVFPICFLIFSKLMALTELLTMGIYDGVLGKQQLLYKWT